MCVRLAKIWKKLALDDIDFISDRNRITGFPAIFCKYDPENKQIKNWQAKNTEYFFLNLIAYSVVYESDSLLKRP